MSSFTIGDREVGDGHPPFLIAEVAQSHDGNLNFAHAFIDAVAGTGADAIKFQTHIADAETTPAEPWRVRFSRQDASRYDYWKRMEWPIEAWRDLKAHAEERGLVFLSSPFSVQAVELLDELGMAAWKIGSGEVSNLPMLRRIASTGRPVLLSSGMSPWAEMDGAVEAVRAVGAPLAVFQCTTAYPCPPEKTGLNVIGELRSRYGCPVGLSDHSATIYPGVAAVALGASLLEVHVTFHPQAFGPDVSSSLTLEELASLATGAKRVATALQNPIDKDAEAERLAPLRAMFTKSIVARADLPAGRVLTEADLDCRKPAGGVPAAEWDLVLGRALAAPIAAGEQLQWSHLAENPAAESAVP